MARLASVFLILAVLTVLIPCSSGPAGHTCGPFDVTTPQSLAQGRSSWFPAVPGIHQVMDSSPLNQEPVTTFAFPAGRVLARVLADSGPMPPREWAEGRPRTQSQAAAAADTGIVYHGNVKSKVFHRPGCRYYNCKNCVAVFQTREEAIEAGFRPCKVCRP